MRLLAGVVVLAILVGLVAWWAVRSPLEYTEGGPSDWLS
jgi:hypothetical protein